MATESSIFKKTIKDYLKQIEEIDLKPLATRLGAELDDETLIVPLFDKPYRVFNNGIIGPTGNQADVDVCVILSKYILMCPTDFPRGKGWVSYRDFRDTGPLTVYFPDNVERPIATHFSGKLDLLKAASLALGGSPPSSAPAYDLVMQFNALPRIALLLLFNDADDEFPAQCSVLFQKTADQFLDPECMAMLARILSVRLHKIDKTITGG
ncbi:MAG: DUF3786 domain-containing protein [Deltaproteobacteria bacterium]|nr:DUF3786 domain-containing protein [Deltaproteobacteria bacterium]